MSFIAAFLLAEPAALGSAATVGAWSPWNHRDGRPWPRMPGAAGGGPRHQSPRAEAATCWWATRWISPRRAGGLEAWKEHRYGQCSRTSMSRMDGYQLASESAAPKHLMAGPASRFSPSPRMPGGRTALPDRGHGRLHHQARKHPRARCQAAPVAPGRGAVDTWRRVPDAELHRQPQKLRWRPGGPRPPGGYSHGGRAITLRSK